MPVDLRDSRWREVSAHEPHPLRHLVRHKVADFTLRVFHGPRSRFGAKFFRLHLENHTGALCKDIVIGLANSGPHPSQNWIEIAGASFEAEFDNVHHTLDPETSECAWHVWQAIADGIPSGGHLMVEYESPEWRETAEGLMRCFPPVVTPLGFLMFRVGCGVNFKDWYFSEGLHEGPRKLQGWKALDEQHARRRAVEMEQEINIFLATATNAEPELLARARKRAAIVLPRLHQLSMAQQERSSGTS